MPWRRLRAPRRCRGAGGGRTAGSGSPQKPEEEEGINLITTESTLKCKVVYKRLRELSPPHQEEAIKKYREICTTENTVLQKLNYVLLTSILKHNPIFSASSLHFAGRKHNAAGSAVEHLNQHSRNRML